MIRKQLILEQKETYLCGYREKDGHLFSCEHPECTDSEGVCLSIIPLWCPLPNVKREMNRDEIAEKKGIELND